MNESRTLSPARKSITHAASIAESDRADRSVAETSDFSEPASSDSDGPDFSMCEPQR